MDNKYQKYLLIVFPLLLGFFGLAQISQAAAFTASVSGNWNDGATWGNSSPGTEGVDWPSTAGGDTVTINGQITVTIPVGHNAKSSGVINAGVTGTHTKLIVNGSLTMDGNITMYNYSEFVMGAGSSLDLGGNILGQDLASNKYYWLSFIGTPGSRITVTSTPSGGSIKPVNIVGSHAYTDVNFQYVDFTNLGDSHFGRSTDTGQNINIDHSSFTSCGDINLGASTINAASNVDVTNSDFSTPTGTNKYLLYIKGVSTPTGHRNITNCTFQWTSNGGVLYMYAVNLNVTNSIFKNIKPTQVTYTNQTVANSVIYNTVSTSALITVLADSDTYNNYLYTNIDNPHTISIGSTSGNALNFYNNIIEATYASYSDSGDHLILTNLNSNIYNNIILDNHGGAMINAISTRTGTYNIYNNTMFGEGTTYGQMHIDDGAGLMAGTGSYRSNIIFDNATGTAARGIRLTNTDTIAYTDYNNFYGLPAGSFNDPYYQVSIAGKIEGDPGFGGYDKAVNPMFYDSARTIATWDTHLSGAGTAANAIAEMLKLNGYGGTFNPNYSVSNLIEWVRYGFSPTNGNLRKAGDPSDSSSTMGAVEWQNPRRKRGM